MASSRRSASDVNILAMLDGLGTRPHAKRSLLWYGAGGLLACGLIGTLVWLAHEPATPLDATVVAGALPIERKADAPPAQAQQPAPARAAIVDLASAPPPAPTTPEPDAPAAPSFAMADSPAPAEPPPHAAAAPGPVPTPHAGAAKSPALRPASAHAAVASVHTGAHAGTAHAGPRRGTAAIKPVPAPTAMDTDVALISAIIQHAANQRDAASDSGCTDKPCGPRTPPQP